MPRPRDARNRGLPANLYEHQRSGYRYRRPDGVDVYLGHNRPAAIQAAIAANAHFTAKSTLFDKIVAGDQKTLATLIGEFIAQKLPAADITDKTRENRKWVLQSIARSPLGTKLVDQLTTRDLHRYLETLGSAWVKQNRRAMFNQVFKWSIQTGLREDNPAAPLDNPKADRKRQRLDYETFLRLRELAPQWLKNAMDLQLQTLQRPGDVLTMRWENVQDDALYIVQQKTQKRLKLRISSELEAILARCRDDIASPFVVHRRPDRLKAMKDRAKRREHHTQILIEQADRELAKVRDRSGLYQPSDSPPTLHEIRSLGGSLYRNAGWSEADVQRLMGHSEIKMTRHYLDGHEAPWEEVAAGLKLS